MSENTHLAAMLGRHYVNTSSSSFAVMPAPGASPMTFDMDDGLVEELPGEPDFNTIEELERLIAICRERGTHKAKFEFLRAAAEMRDQGRILWPMGLLWHQSAIGRLEDRNTRQLLHELYPDTVALRKSLDELPTIQRMETDRSRQVYAFAYWKMIMALRMSVEGIQGLSDVHDGHAQIMARIFRPSGEWASWVHADYRKMSRSLMTCIGEMRQDPAFGQSMGRVHYSGRGARSMEKSVSHPWLRWVDDSYERWIDAQHLLQKKAPRKGKKLLLDYLATLPETATAAPGQIFARPSVEGLLRHATTWGTDGQRLYALSRILAFADWLADESRDDTGRSTFVQSLTARDLARLRSTMGAPTASSNAEVVARPMPQRFHAMLKEIIAGEDFAWPKSLMAGADVPKLWSTWTDPVTGVGQSVFCEVLPRLLLLLLDLPLRTLQARRLDSGEGDDERWDPVERAWAPNTGRHAGYWTRKRARNTRRGVFRRIDGAGVDGTTITGFYINSNKTQDSTVLWDENSGYEIPWQHEEVLDNLAAMRAWQERYNPVHRPLSLKDTPKGIMKDEPTASVRDRVPDRFYLFRYPLNAGRRGNEAPPSYAALLQFFHDALSELERRLNQEDPTADFRIITRRDPSGLPKQAIYTMHGMRSSTITALYAEGVPIGMLSKLVAGHATILMTLKYVKYTPGHVSEVLTDARQKALASQAGKFAGELSRASYDEAARMTAFLVPDGLQQVQGQYAGAATWAAMDIGICPNGQTLCHIGGERIVKRQERGGPDKSPYRPVPGGPRNCVRCRFFVTGLPFLIPLCGKANAISARTERVASRIAEIEAEMKPLKLERHEQVSNGRELPNQTRRRIEVLEAEWEAGEVQRDQQLADFHATTTLIEKIRALAKSQQADGKVPMLINEEGVPDLVGRESTRFELTDAVVQMGRFFPSLASEDLERERDGFIDRVLYREGFVPFAMSPLRPDEKRRAADALAALLLGELGAQETENLIQGRKTLAELGLQHGFDDVVHRALGRPLDRIGLPAPTPEVLVLDAAPAVAAE